MKETKVIALAGKGGVGKTSLAAAMVKVLAEKHPDKRILAIDADPAVGLSTALGVTVEKTIDDIRKNVINTAEEGNTKAAVELLGEANYQILEALVEKGGFSFIAVGRPESAGCYCKVNSYLKDVIALLADNFDYIVIDGEAGIEQINRRVMEKVTHLVLVSDASKKGTDVIKTIKQVADDLIMYDKAGDIINRLPDDDVKDLIDVGDLQVLAWIGADSELVRNDIAGKSVLEMSNDSNVVRGAREALEAILGGEA